jgi:hypothetical protein
MYGLENIDFSNPLGAIVSEPLPDELDHQDQPVNEPEALSLPARDHLAMAIFGAA